MGDQESRLADRQTDGPWEVRRAEKQTTDGPGEIMRSDNQTGTLAERRTKGLQLSRQAVSEDWLRKRKHLFKQVDQQADRQTRGERTDKQTGRETNKGRKIEQTSRLVNYRTMGEQLSRQAEWQTNREEMRFMDIRLTKDSSLLLHDIHSPFYWRILKKTILFSGFKHTYKNPRQKKSRVYSWISFCRKEKWG